MLVRYSKSFFSDNSLPQGTAYTKFMQRNKPTQQVFKKLFDSIPFINDSADTASTTTAGHIRLATDIEVAARTSTWVDGHKRCVQPHQLSAYTFIRYGYLTGAADAYTITYSPAITAYETGVIYAAFLGTPALNNTGACTLNINGLGVKNIKNIIGGNLIADDIPNSTSAILLFMYTISDQFVLLNPSNYLNSSGNVVYQGLIANGGIISKGLLVGGINVGPDTGSANDYFINISQTFFSDYELGQRFTLINAANDNTAASQFTFGTLSTKAIKTNCGSDLSAAMIKTGGTYDLVYNGTDFILMNPSSCP